MRSVVEGCALLGSRKLRRIQRATDLQPCGNSFEEKHDVQYASVGLLGVARLGDHDKETDCTSTGMSVRDGRRVSWGCSKASAKLGSLEWYRCWHDPVGYA